MFKVRTYNKIAVKGLDLLGREEFEVASEIQEPDAILLRSHKLHDEVLPQSLLAIGRAGAGVNNIPIERCSEEGVIVFNTPGANANAVKELVLLGMFMASRNVLEGVQFAQTLQGKGSDVGPIVEKNKSSFVGCELKGKKLGVLGLGSIGLMVANAAIDLGMEVEGFDPYLSVNRAWELSSSVKPAPSLERMLRTSDFVTVHVPFSEKTKSILNNERIQQLKEGAVLLNFSRDALVDQEGLLNALDNKSISRYVTDFPLNDLLGRDDVISIPHLGASTGEAEENCAVMIANQVSDFLKNGTIKNSVNYPDCFAERMDNSDRLVIINKNVPSVIGHITTLLAEHNVNILEMVNKSKGDFAYNIVDCEGSIDDSIVSAIQTLEGVIRVRKLEPVT